MNKVNSTLMIDEWLAATGVPEYRLGLMACANPRAVERVRSGTARVDSLHAILEYIEKNPANEPRKRK